jgi:hypothetical protein
VMPCFVGFGRVERPIWLEPTTMAEDTE